MEDPDGFLKHWYEREGPKRTASDVLNSQKET